MDIKEHQKETGFSGNDIYCLNKLGLNAGQLCLGNNVLALGVLKNYCDEYNSQYLCLNP